MRKTLFAAATLALASLPLAPVWGDASEEEIAAIIDEGLSHSRAMSDASELMDGIGPRLTNSEGYDRAADWAIARFREYGVANPHRQPFPFGLGWNLDAWSATMVEPRQLSMRAIPVGWSPATDGAIRAPVVLAPIDEEQGFEKYRGQLAGRIVMISEPGRASESTAPQFRRYEAGELAGFDTFTLPPDDLTPYTEFVESNLFPLALSRFLVEEGALAMVRMSYRDNGLTHGTGYLFEAGKVLQLPFMELAAEDYRRLARLEMAGEPPVIELAIDARFDRRDLTADNIIAEIPGTDPDAGYVMAGAHFDSWHAADGATDNGAPSVAVIEAARILAGLGVRPKRTIRFALWAGEEQGLLGSMAYVEENLATRAVDPALSPMEKFAQWTGAFPVTRRPGYGDLKAYFNLDNGAGRIRGIYAENNIGAIPVLRRWLSPFSSMGAGNVVARAVGGTDHMLLQAVGLPAFQFIQDPLDYSTRTHHSSLDTLDHVPPDDLRQSATVLAGVLWQAANAEAELPRAPLPTQPTRSDPFHFEDGD